MGVMLCRSSSWPISVHTQVSPWGSNFYLLSRLWCLSFPSLSFPSLLFIFTHPDRGMNVCFVSDSNWPLYLSNLFVCFVIFCWLELTSCTASFQPLMISFELISFILSCPAVHHARLIQAAKICLKCRPRFYSCYNLQGGSKIAILPSMYYKQKCIRT